MGYVRACGGGEESRLRRSSRYQCALRLSQDGGGCGLLGLHQPSGDLKAAGQFRSAAAEEPSSHDHALHRILSTAAWDAEERGRRLI